MRYVWILALMAGCPVSGDDDDETGTDSTGDLFDSERASGNSDLNGVVTLTVEMASGQDAFMISASSDSFLALEEIYDPRGNRILTWSDWYDEYSLTESVFADYRDVYINWPIREEDGPIEAGTYEVVLATVNGSGSYQSNQRVDATIQRRRDEDLTRGTVSVRLSYAADLADDPDVTAGIEAAMERWSQVWAPFGLEVNWTTGEAVPETGVLDAPDAGTWGDVTAGSEDTELTLVIGSGVDSSDTFGMAGCIPCSTVASGRGLVIVSWLAHAGADGELSEEEIRLFGETMAHEAGHHMGLFHPVEDGWEYWDAIGDTTDCKTTDSCESALGDNLMFPYPVCTWSECTPQDKLSNGQQGVKHRWAATL